MANEQRGGSGNFAHDRERASEAGKKGGERSHDGRNSKVVVLMVNKAETSRMIGKRPAGRP